ncbi:UNVERIFIED_CONTAM: hypothetical protein HDU68_003097, partial [Siphonaria sp. JEL0065]
LQQRDYGDDRSYSRDLDRRDRSGESGMGREDEKRREYNRESVEVEEGMQFEPTGDVDAEKKKKYSSKKVNALFKNSKDSAVPSEDRDKGNEDAGGGIVRWVSISSQFGTLLGLAGGIFLLKVIPLIVWACVPHHQTHKQQALWQLLPLSHEQKVYWLQQNPDEFARIEAWLIVDALYFASPVAVDLLLGFLFEFIDGASGDKTFPASRLHLLPHAVMFLLCTPIAYFMYDHGKELFVSLAPVGVPLAPIVYVQAQPQQQQQQYYTSY